MSHTIRRKLSTPSTSSFWRLAIAALFTVACAGSVRALELDASPPALVTESTVTLAPESPVDPAPTTESTSVAGVELALGLAGAGIFLAGTDLLLRRRT